ncbi:hypothetical protein BJX70DRAFT_151004 [Aspergillus crustosus]
MSIRRGFRGLSRPLCELIEKRLERSDRWRCAQRFRRKQHYLFGLSKEELRMLRLYVATWNFLGDFIQRDRTIAERMALLRDLLTDTTLTDDEIRGVQLQIQATEEERKSNIEICRSGFKRTGSLCFELDHLPIFRGLTSFHIRPSWHMLPSLRVLCARSGGCCGRDCGHCEVRSRSGTFRTYFKGHCTEACHCCQKHWGDSKPVALVDTPLQCLFREDLEEGDILADWITDAYVWGLSGTKGFCGAP